MKVFISGGVKNGKSFRAQRIAKALAGAKPLYYVATMEPHDEEDEARIARHRREREGWGFTTLECGRDLAGCVGKLDQDGVYLFDSVTALLSNEMFDGGVMDESAPVKVADAIAGFTGAVRDIVIVSDFIFSDADRYDYMTESFRRGLAYVDRRLVSCCDTVLEICAGQAFTHKGGLAF